MSEEIEFPKFEIGTLTQQVYGWEYVIPETERRSGVKITLSVATAAKKARWRIDLEYMAKEPQEANHIYCPTDAMALMYFGYLIIHAELRAHQLDHHNPLEGMSIGEFMAAMADRRTRAVPMEGSPTGTYKTITIAQPDGNYL